MFEGFSGKTGVFQRQRLRATLAALLVYGGAFAFALLQRPDENPVDVVLEPEVKDLAIEEAPAEAEPPPPPSPEVKVVKKPRPTPKIPPPQAPVESKLEESDKPAAVEVGVGQGGAGRGKPSGGDKPKPVEKPAPPPAVEKSKAPDIDPSQPIDRPERASLPKPNPDNKPPEYPPSLRDKGITGEIVVKLHIHFDGSVKTMKILRKENTAPTEEEKKDAAKLFLAAVARVVQTWRYEPAKLDGRPISIWYPVTFPFSLTTG